MLHSGSVNVRAGVAGAVILAAVFVASAAPAVATGPACTRYVDGSTDEVFAGEVVCGGAHDDHVGVIDAGGTFVGGDGFDSAEVNSGTFVGGPGADRVLSSNDGVFYGEDGQDAVEGVNEGTFVGGGGSDQIAVNRGTFLGGDSVDVVFRSDAGGVFFGGDGGDIVGRMNDGTFDGGAGHDHVFRYIAGTLISVEDVN